jgi:hypothetical protein
MQKGMLAELDFKTNMLISNFFERVFLIRNGLL